MRSSGLWTSSISFLLGLMPSIIQVDNYRATQSMDNGHLKFEKIMEYILKEAQVIFITAGESLPRDVIFQNQSSICYGHTRFRILLQDNA